MTETTTQNGVDATQSVTLDGAALANYLAYQEAERVKAAKAEAAKQARIRANNRPTDVNGDEKPASLSYVHVLADLLEAFGKTYALDSDAFMRRVMAEIQPNARSMGNTDRKLAGVTYDVQRKGLTGMFPPADAVAPAPSKK